MKTLVHRNLMRRWPLLVAGLALATASCSSLGPDGGRAARADAYAHACWLDGLRKTRSDTNTTLFAIETTRYGLALDLGDFRRAGFGLRQGMVPSYAGSLTAPTDWLRGLPAATLDIEIDLAGRTYRALRAKAGVGNGNDRFKQVRLWESGRFVQHYDFLDLELRDANGALLPGRVALDLVAWPGSLTLTGFITPGDGTATSNAPAWRDAKLRLGFQGEAIDCRTEKTFAGAWPAGETREVTVTRAIEKPSVVPARIEVTHAGARNFPAAFDPRRNCLVSTVTGLKRPFAGGYTDIRRYDEFTIRVEQDGTSSTETPFLLELRGLANATGLCPVLCDMEGRPTGIPVQLSKNWHQGEYLMAYMNLPAGAGSTSYLLRVAYGFYGTLPSASHAQLSLVGYGGNGRWDQLAVGCWGETFCFDMDMTCVNVAITDVRGLMLRNGPSGKKWGWTDAGWGGDWLGLQDAAGDKLPFAGMRTAYLAHGPCMSEVRHAGFYGAGRAVTLDARIRNIRSDDYARTFQRLKYTFNTAAPAAGVWFHKVGGTAHYVTPRAAYGNRDGLLVDLPVDGALKAKELAVARVTPAGAAPWWAAFPGAKSTDGRDWGTGYRALVIRSYEGRFGGKRYAAPTFSMPVNKAGKEGTCLDLLLVAPAGVDTFQPGDTVEMDLEWITLPRVADDYYGPNEALRRHLAEHPSSWRTTYREARGNDLRVQVDGGVLREAYPIVIAARAPEVTVTIEGGVGHVPIRFEGLPSATGYVLHEVAGDREIELDQSVHGNDFWQVDRDDGSQSYRWTFNLPLDGRERSVWRLGPVRRP